MNFENITKTKYFKGVFYVIGALVILITVFSLGIKIGFHKANFSYSWGENYERNFGGPRGGMMRNFQGSGGIRGRMMGGLDNNFINPHGTSGVVLKIDNNALVILGNDNNEKTVSVNEKTIIRKPAEVLKLSDIKIGDNVMIIGAPNNVGQIEAKFIRLFDTANTNNTVNNNATTSTSTNNIN